MQAIETLVSEKAKSWKVSKTKLLALAEEIALVAQKQQDAVAGIVHNASSEKIREAIMKQKGEFTSKDIASELNVTVVAVNNNLFSLQRRGIVSPTGETRKHGGRGKPATVWRLVQA